MKRVAAALVALALLLPAGALAEGRCFAIDRVQGSNLYAWDGTQLTPSGTYFLLYSVTAGRTAPEGELFIAQSALLELPEDGDYPASLFAIVDAGGRRLTDFLYESVEYDPASDALVVMMDSRCGVLSRSMEQLLPCEYDAVLPNGQGGFLLAPHNDLDAPPILYVEKGGSPRKTGANARFYWSSFSEGLCAATGENGLYGCLDAQGRWAIEPRFESVQSFSGGYAVARSAGRTGVIDRSGAWVIKPTYDDDRGILPGGGAVLMLRGSRAYLLSLPSGRRLFSVLLTKDGYASAGQARPLISVTDKGKSTLIDARGRAILTLEDAFSFDLWSALPEDRLLVSASNDCRLLDSSGRLIFKAQELTAIDSPEGRSLLIPSRYKTRTYQYDSRPYEEPLYDTARYGLIDSDGNVLLPMIYRTLYPLVPGRYYAEDARRWGVIDEAGNWIVSGSQFDELLD